MSEELKAGDVVELKSGGPEMTISSIGDLRGEVRARCDWFEGSTSKYGSFPVTSLRKVERARPAGS
jgi:uncharacterized protein YodC (DUF2158 family)